MREKDIEHTLVTAVKRCGGAAVKFIFPGFDGMPDRIVLLRGGKLGFVEVKAPGKHTRPLQTVRYRMLQKLGFKVYVIDSVEQIEGVINDIRAT